MRSINTKFSNALRYHQSLLGKNQKLKVQQFKVDQSVYAIIYIYIYIYDGCPLSFERDHLFYLMSSPPSPTSYLNCMCS